MSGLRHPWTGLTGLVNLGVLSRWASRELVAAAVAGRARVPDRASPLTPEFMVRFMVGLALWSQDSYGDVLDNLVAGVPELAGGTVDKSSLAWARLRLGEAAMAAVFTAVAAGPVAGPGTVGARWNGRLVLAVDGFTVDVPETRKNRAGFGGPDNGVRATRARPYPQAKVVTVTECGTHGLRAAAIGGYATGERELAEQLLDSLDEHTVVLFDAGFPSVRLFQRLNATGAAVVMRAAPRIGHRILTRLPDGSALVQLIASGHSTCSDHCEHRVTVRTIEYRVGQGKPIRLLTNLTDPDTAPAPQLSALYRERWQAEQTFREIKTIQQGREYVLRSHTPTLVRQEILAHLTLHVMLRRLAVELAERNSTDPDRISFTRVLKHARRSVITQTIAIAETVAGTLHRWLNPTRPARTSPRTVKRARNRYKLRPPGSIGTAVTTPAPTRTLTLIPQHP